MPSTGVNSPSVCGSRARSLTWHEGFPYEWKNTTLLRRSSAPGRVPRATQISGDKQAGGGCPAYYRLGTAPSPNIAAEGGPAGSASAREEIET